MEACNNDDELLIRYYLLIWEYMFGHDEYSYEENWTKMYTIEDIRGVQMWHITPHVVSFLKKLTSCTKVIKHDHSLIFVPCLSQILQQSSILNALRCVLLWLNIE